MEFIAQLIGFITVTILGLWSLGCAVVGSYVSVAFSGRITLSDGVAFTFFAVLGCLLMWASYTMAHSRSA